MKETLSIRYSNCQTARSDHEFGRLSYFCRADIAKNLFLQDRLSSNARHMEIVFFKTGIFIVHNIKYLGPSVEENSLKQQYTIGDATVEKV